MTAPGRDEEFAVTGSITAELEVGPDDQVADFELVHEHLGDELLRFEMADLGEVEHPDSVDAEIRRARRFAHRCL